MSVVELNSVATVHYSQPPITTVTAVNRAVHRGTRQFGNRTNQIHSGTCPGAYKPEATGQINLALRVLAQGR